MATSDRIRRFVQQYQTTTGRQINPDVLQALLTSELDVEAGRRTQDREYELRKQQQKNEAEAAKTSGLIQAGGTAIQAGMLLKGTKAGKAITGGIKSGATKIFGGGATAAGSGEGTGAALQSANGLSYTSGGGYVPSAVAGGGAAGTAALSTGAAAQEAAGLTYVAGGGYVPAGVAGGTTTGTVTAGTAGGGTASGSAIGVAGPIAAAVAADQILGNEVGQYKSPQQSWEANVRGITRYGGISPGAVSLLEKAVPGLKNIPNSPLESTIASATAGTIPEFLGGSQKGILPDVGQIAKDSGTVICTQMYVQGHIPYHILILDGKHRAKFIDDKTYEGYLKWAEPLVEKMRESKFISRLVRPFAVAWAYEMAHRMNPKIKGRLLGKILLKIGVPVCSFIGGKGAKYAIS